MGFAFRGGDATVYMPRPHGTQSPDFHASSPSTLATRAVGCARQSRGERGATILAGAKPRKAQRAGLSDQKARKATLKCTKGF